MLTSRNASKKRASTIDNIASREHGPCKPWSRDVLHKTRRLYLGTVHDLNMRATKLISFDIRLHIRTCNAHGRSHQPWKRAMSRTRRLGSVQSQCLPLPDPPALYT
jgi:hypothetical protein